jgi:hypothetical protein
MRHENATGRGFGVLVTAGAKALMQKPFDLSPIPHSDASKCKSPLLYVDTLIQVIHSAQIKGMFTHDK